MIARTLFAAVTLSWAALANAGCTVTPDVNGHVIAAQLMPYIDGTTVRYLTLDMKNCLELVSVELPAIHTLTPGQFEGCTNLVTVTFSVGTDDSNTLTELGSSAFSGCTSLETITFPDSLISMSSYVFVGCTSLTYVTLPAGFTTMGSHVFSGCTSLKNVYLPAGLTAMGTNTFEGCTSLETVCGATQALVDSISSDQFYLALSDLTTTMTSECPATPFAHLTHKDTMHPSPAPVSAPPPEPDQWSPCSEEWSCEADTDGTMSVHHPRTDFYDKISSISSVTDCGTNVLCKVCVSNNGYFGAHHVGATPKCFGYGDVHKCVLTGEGACQCDCRNTAPHKNSRFWGIFEPDYMPSDAKTSLPIPGTEENDGTATVKANRLGDAASGATSDAAGEAAGEAAGIACASGFYNANGIGACSPHASCTAGQYLTGQSTWASGSCSPCATGTYNTNGVGTCSPHTLCDPGYYLTGESAIVSGSCFICADGTHNTDGLGDCIAHTICSAGQYLTWHSPLGGIPKPLRTSTPGTCVTCASGFYNANGVGNCSSHNTCTSGQYLTNQSWFAPGSCTGCGPGTYNIDGVGNCSPHNTCGAGQILNGASTTAPGTCSAPTPTYTIIYAHNGYNIFKSEIVADLGNSLDKALAACQAMDSNAKPIGNYAGRTDCGGKVYVFSSAYNGKETAYGVGTHSPTSDPAQMDTATVGNYNAGQGSGDCGYGSNTFIGGGQSWNTNSNGKKVQCAVPAL